MTLPELGHALRRAGLVPRALAAWAGTDRLSALPRALPAAITPAGAVLALFAGGAEVPLELVRRLPLDALAGAGLVELTADHARAPLAILPLALQPGGEALLACDRRDAPDSPELVCWPDDSSYHLARALPAGRVERWIDLGGGSAFAQLARPALAAHMAAADRNPRAAAHARLGAALSGLANLEVFEGELADPLPAAWHRAALVTCNAPIPLGAGEPTRAIWRTAGADIVARVFEHAGRMVARDGLVVVHAALDALVPVVAALPGERVVVAYTPEAARGFAVAWWAPGGEARHVACRRVLTRERPHLDPADRLAALAGELPSLP